MFHNNGVVINFGGELVSKFEDPPPPHDDENGVGGWFELHLTFCKTISDGNLIRCFWILCPFCGES
jgi:hypothetical protein